MQAPTPWRYLLYKKLSTLSLSGKVLDLGGSRKSHYHEFFKDAQIEVANMDAEYGYDVLMDLEKPIELPVATYEGLLCINTLEHILNASQLVSESHRILKEGGTMITAVPFMHHIHPCPHDYWRFTDETLHHLFINAGFKEVEITPIAPGIIGMIAQVLYNILYFSLLRKIVVMSALAVDKVLSLSKRYRNLASRYVLGYVVVAKS